MKSLLFTIIGAFILFTSSSCQTEAPSKVRSAFKEKFPDVTKVKWEMENDNEWEAEFKSDGLEGSASFDLEGKWLETEMEIITEDLPANVFKALYLEYEKFEIEEAVSLSSPDFMGYELSVEILDGKKEKEFEVKISEDGKTIQMVKENDDEDDEKAEVKDKDQYNKEQEEDDD
ncbi:MAG: PepSY-like domain-containing protein [Bacteroidales bacterium]|nr:PepSY-like domain-containing protein [Bacteroidales bacterium]MCF8403989.1 PepSY-like domain-containing protein [Bacteroidales bacterium]